MAKIPRDLQIGENNYRIGQLDARTQFHVARRLTPVIAAYAGGENSKPLEMFAKIAVAIGSLDDATCDYVIDKCYTVVFREDAKGTWMPMIRGKVLMFNDLEMEEMIQLVSAVIQDNMGDFMSGVPGQTSSPGAPA